MPESAVLARDHSARGDASERALRRSSVLFCFALFYFARDRPPRPLLRSTCGCVSLILRSFTFLAFCAEPSPCELLRVACSRDL